jgi:biotin synthase-related radical SAM superfamily protein
MEEDLNRAYRKAVLITGGDVKVSKDFRPPFRLSRSTAGPGAGSRSLVIAFQGMRVKKTISTETGEFELVFRGEGYALLRKGEEFLDEVQIRPVVFHAPEQAFFNLDQRCIYSCKFCASPRLEKEVTKSLTPDKVVEMILAADRDEMRSVAVTSAVVDSPAATVERMAYVISRVREALPDIPIGVEPYVDSLEQIDRLKEAGADEIKLNLESNDPAIFEKVCGELDIDWIMEALAHAVKVFGRGKVCSNIIYGMGESDDNVLDGVESLASMGVVATLRGIRINDTNREMLEEALGPLEPVTAERMVRLAKAHKAILERHGLSTLTFSTMCHECTCCDIVPFRDI